MRLIQEIRKHKKSFVMGTGNWVTLYAIGYMILTLFYCLPRLIVQIAPIENVGRIVSWMGADCTSGIPLEIFAWGLLAICTGYAGIDRAALAVKTSMMEIGTCDMGDPKKLRKVIYLLFAIFLESVILNFIFGKDMSVLSGFERLEDGSQGAAIFTTFAGLKLPQEGVSSALVSTISIYILGNKSIRLTQNIDSTGGASNEDKPWANEVDNVTMVDGEDATVKEATVNPINKA